MQILNKRSVSKVLFSPSYFYRFDKKQWKDQSPYPPYGTICAMALLRQEGFETLLFDTHLRKSPSEIIPLLQKERPRYMVIYDDGFNYLTKMCLTAMREAAFDLINYAKAIDCTVIVCSSDSSDHYGKYLLKGADYILLGEGELTLLELIQKLEAQELEPSQLLGIAYKEAETVKVNPRRPVLRDLDSLPDPAWDLIDIPAYKNIWENAHGYFSLNIATTRGCPFKCNWCAKPIYGNRYNSRSPHRVASEMQMLQQEYGVDHFWICDDIFGLKPKWVQLFREEVKKRNLTLRYKIQSRVDLLLKEDNINALADSGLESVWVGAESGSQKILDAMDKGTSIDQIYESTQLLQSKGIKVGFFLQFGYLGETMKEIQLTIDMLLDLMPDDIGISVSYPLPNTLFYEKVKNQLKTKQNWVNSDDLDMMYSGTYSPVFYKRLHRFVHKVFRRRQAWLNLKKLLRAPGKSNATQLRSIFTLAYYLPSAEFDRIRLHRLAIKRT